MRILGGIPPPTMTTNEVPRARYHPPPLGPQTDPKAWESQATASAVNTSKFKLLRPFKFRTISRSVGPADFAGCKQGGRPRPGPQVDRVAAQQHSIPKDRLRIGALMTVSITKIHSPTPTARRSSAPCSTARGPLEPTSSARRSPAQCSPARSAKEEIPTARRSPVFQCSAWYLRFQPRALISSQLLALNQTRALAAPWPPGSCRRLRSRTPPSDPSGRPPGPFRRPPPSPS